MSQEFDIRIGTKLDTTTAENQLRDFINKYSDKPMDINLGIKGENELARMAKSLNDIKNFSKSIGDIKLNVKGNFKDVVGGLDSKLGKVTQTTIADIEKSMLRIGDTVDKGTKKSGASLGNSVDQIYLKIKGLEGSIANLKLDPKIDKGSLDEFSKTLKQIENTDMSKFGKLGVNLAKEGLKDVEGKINQVEKELIEVAKASKDVDLKRIFEVGTLTPFLGHLENVRTVLSSKGLDTGGIDIISSKVRALFNSTKDIDHLRNSYASLQSELTNIKVAVEISDVKSAETAIKHLEETKLKLNNAISVKVDQNEIKALELQVKNTDIGIKTLQSRLDEIGKSTNISIGQIMDSKEVEKATKEISKLEKESNKLKGQFDKLKGSPNVDVSKMSAVSYYINEVQKSIGNLDMQQVGMKDVAKITKDVDLLKISMDDLASSTKTLSLEDKFNADLSKVTKQINGFKSALISGGYDTTIVDEYKKDLKDIENMSKINLDGAVNKLKLLGNSIKEVNKADFKFKDISGNVNQFKQISSEIDNLNKKLANTSNVEIAKGLEEQIQRKTQALKQLESGLDSAQMALISSQPKGGNDYSKAITNMISDAQKLQKVFNNINSSSKTVGLSEEFSNSQTRLSALNQALLSLKNNTNVDPSKIQSLQTELKETESVAKNISKVAIKVECDSAISQLDKLQAEFEQTGRDASKIKELKMDLGNVLSQSNSGLLDFKDATKGIDKVKNETKLINDAEIKRATSQVNSLKSEVDKLKASFDKVKSSADIDSSKLSSVEAYIKGIDSSLDKLDMNKLNSNSLNETSNKVENLRNVIKSFSNESKEIKFGVNLDNVSTQLNGLKSAMISAGKDISGLGKFEEGLKNIENLSKTNIDGALNQLDNLSKKMKEFNNNNFKFKNVDGGVSQFKQITSEIDSLNKKLANTSNVEIAKGLEEQIQRKTQALKQLESQFDSYQKQQSLSIEIPKGGYSKELDGMINKLQKIQTLTNNVGGGTQYNNLTAENGKLSKEYEQIQAKVISLSQSLKSLSGDINVDPSKIQSLQTELKETEIEAKRLSKVAIQLQCEGAIAELNRLQSEFNEIGRDTSKIKELKSVLDNVFNQSNNNSLGFKDADKTISSVVKSAGKLNDELTKIKASSSIGETRELEKTSRIMNGLEKEVEKVVAGFEKLKKNTDVDISKMAETEACIISIANSFDKLKGKKITLEDTSKIAKDVENLNRVFKDFKKSSENLKLEGKFNADFSKVTQQLNGFKSALISAGQSTDKIKEFETILKSIEGNSKINLGQAINQLKELSETIDRVNKADFKFKDIGGNVSQFKQISSEIDNLNKKLAGTSNVEIAKGLEEQIQRKTQALKQLESGFDSYQRKQSESFKGQSGGGYSNEIDKMTVKIQKLQTVLNSMGTGSQFGNLTGIGGQLANEFEQAQSKVTYLKQALDSLKGSANVDSSKIQKLQAELDLAGKEAVELSKMVITVQCDSAISQLDKLQAEFEQTGRDASKIKELKTVLGNVSSQYNGGTLGFKDASKMINGATKEASKFSNEMNKVGKTTSSSVGKVEGFFKTIYNSFSSFGLGMMLSRAVMGLSSGIKKTITELDASLTDVSRVLPDNVSASADNLKGIADTAKNIAKEVGQSTEDVIKGMATALRAGATTMEQATQIAKSSAIFQNVTDMDAESASKAVASLINQYYSMDTALSQVSTGAGRAVKDYNNLTEAMDLVNYAGLM